MTYEELKIRQNWTLHQKIDHAAGTIESFLSQTEGKAYISFSGGKDSTVLLDIARRFVRRGLPAVFSSVLFMTKDADEPAVCFVGLDAI